jgi:DNA adenine methylase
MSRTPTITPPLKWHGGKHYVAKRAVELMPPHLHYVEPFFGGGRVLLAKAPGGSELANDLDGRLVNFFRVVRDPGAFPQFLRQVSSIPLARAEWEAARGHVYGADQVADAVAFFVFCRQSRSGQMKSFTPPTRTRLRRGMNGNVSEWLGAVEGLLEIHERLRRVMFECKPALDLIRREDKPGTLFYLDPPYLHETRKSTRAYAHEMTDADHLRLLDVARGVKGKVILSGYASPMYDDALSGWHRETIDLPNHAAGGATKRRMTEVLWCNFGPAPTAGEGR